VDLCQKNILPKFELFCDALESWHAAPSAGCPIPFPGKSRRGVRIQPVGANHAPSEAAGKGRRWHQDRLKIGKSIIARDRTELEARGAGRAN